MSKRDLDWGDVYADAALMQAQQEADSCQWFLLCDRLATTTVSHPVLGNVPACDRCAERAKA